MGIEIAKLRADAITLKKIRELYKLTQVEAAKIIKCTQCNVSKLDNRPITLAYLLAITKAAGHQVNILITKP